MVWHSNHIFLGSCANGQQGLETIFSTQAGERVSFVLLFRHEKPVSLWSLDQSRLAMFEKMDVSPGDVVGTLRSEAKNLFAKQRDTEPHRPFYPQSHKAKQKPL